MPQRFTFDHLALSDLLVDAVYEGGTRGNASDDPLGRLVGGGNQGGFRYEGSPAEGSVRFCVLYSDLGDADWPDTLFVENGRFIYYGDNKRPGHELHDTPRRGNQILRNAFEAMHRGNRRAVPPFFIFTKQGEGRNVTFRGLAVPGAIGVSQTEDLVAIWRTTAGERFQNYRAIFSILNVPVIRREWLIAVRSEVSAMAAAPEAWIKWQESGAVQALEAPKTRSYRTRKEQLPKDPADWELLRTLVAFYKEHPRREYAFERCAGEIVRLMDPNVATVDLTRPWKDGGRDATGQYRIGTPTSAVGVDYALEAKCKNPESSNSCGVEMTSRLISRLRHRQFGVFVTTSCVHEDAQKEIFDDRHPVLLLAGADIVYLLRRSGITCNEDLLRWLKAID